MLVMDPNLSSWVRRNFFNPSGFYVLGYPVLSILVLESTWRAEAWSRNSNTDFFQLCGPPPLPRGF